MTDVELVTRKMVPIAAELQPLAVLAAHPVEADLARMTDEALAEQT
jgi:hypothetical protein